MAPAPRATSSQRLMASDGITLPAHLPELEGHHCRSESEVVDRLLCLHAVAAVAYGLRRETALEWVNEEGLAQHLEPAEARFLRDQAGYQESFRAHVEGMFALAWALQLHSHLDFWTGCDADFVHRLPNLKIREPSATLRKASCLRSSAEVLAMADLGYCLHWAMRESQLKNAPLRSNPNALVVEQRRRALEWLIGDDHWSATSLDT